MDAGVEPEETKRQVLCTNPSEGKESPHYKRVQDAGDWPFPNYPRLQKDLGEDSPEAPDRPINREVTVGCREHWSQPAPHRTRKVRQARQQERSKHDSPCHSLG